MYGSSGDELSFVTKPLNDSTGVHMPDLHLNSVEAVNHRSFSDRCRMDTVMLGSRVDILSSRQSTSSGSSCDPSRTIGVRSPEHVANTCCR